MAFVRNNNSNNGRRHNNNYSNNRHRHPTQQHRNSGQNPNGQRRHVNRVNQVFESTGPDGRVRGTAQQIVEKYTSMARDANVVGDKVLSLNYFQHAEHYQRLLNEINEENAVFEKEREATRQQQQQSQPEIPADAATEGFALSEQPSVEPRAERQERPERPERTERTERPQRTERPERSERAPRPERVQRERRPADDIDDNELPSFLQVPIKTGKPAVEAAPVAAAPAAPVAEAATPRPRVARPRRVAAPEATEGDAE